jgi:uncharacterized membrane protein YeaQ/YmgE (transglycosylase-associated protein family)
MFSIIFWVTFGATIGWAAAIVKNVRHSLAIGGYILSGAAGGLVGGFLGAMLDPTTAGYPTPTSDMAFAFFGAAAFVFSASFIARKLSNQNQSHQR